MIQNVAAKVHILRNHYKWFWGSGHYDLDYRGVNNWAGVDYIICAPSKYGQKNFCRCWRLWLVLKGRILFCFGLGQPEQCLKLAPSAMTDLYKTNCIHEKTPNKFLKINKNLVNLSPKILSPKSWIESYNPKQHKPNSSMSWAWKSSAPTCFLYSS